MAEDPWVRKDIYDKDIGHFDERLDILQADMREVKALSMEIINHGRRITQLENGQKSQMARVWKLIFILIGIAFLGNLPDLLPLIAKAFK